MKPEFTLACPYCGETHGLNQDNIEDFYDGHVARCRHTKAGLTVTADGTPVGPMRIEAQSFADRLRFTGRALIRLFDGDGQLKDARIASNLVVDAGKGLIIDRLQGVSGPPAVPDYQAVGTGSTAAAAGDTALGTEIGTRVQGTLSQPTALTDRLISVFAAGNGTGAITETGRLNASTNGVLLARLVFSVVNKAAGDSLSVTHDVLVS